MANDKSPASQFDSLIGLLSKRFEHYSARHKGLQWQIVQRRLEAAPKKLRALYELEQTGGEPDVVGIDKQTGEFLFVDCAVESPKGRRSLCYDRAALDARKEHKPKNDVLSLVSAMGAELLTEEQYRYLQTLGEFDLKTSSWIHTPSRIRALGGALFCDRRYDTVFVYHNGAESYYAARGFRCLVRV